MSSEYIQQIIRDYDLPELPEEGEGDRTIILFRFKEENIVLAEDVLLEDAREYASRDDTHGPDWFVGFQD